MSDRSELMVWMSKILGNFGVMIIREKNDVVSLGKNITCEKSVEKPEEEDTMVDMTCVVS